MPRSPAPSGGRARSRRSSRGSRDGSRLNLTRTAACGICAFAIAFLLQVVFFASFLPAVLSHGSTSGAETSWWFSLVLAMLRTSLVTSLAAMLGVALATLGRNTAFALGAVFAWVAVVEGLIRGLRPCVGAVPLGREHRDHGAVGPAAEGRVHPRPAPRAGDRRRSTPPCSWSRRRSRSSAATSPGPRSADLIAALAGPGLHCPP